MNKHNKILNLILPIITISCILIVWTFGAILVDSEYLLPSIKLTLKEFFRLFLDGRFYTAFAFTLLRSFIAFLFSFMLASLLAFLSSKSKTAEGLILPFISVVRALPTLAIILLLIFWTNEQIAPIVVTALVVMPTTYTHVKSALELIDKTSVEAGRVDGATKKESFLKIELPQIAPAIYSAIGGGLSLNLKLMVAAEVMSATVRSLGTMLNISNYNDQTAKMLALVLVVLIIGLLIEFFFNFLSKKTGNWR